MMDELAKSVSWAKGNLKSVPLIFGRADDLNRSEWKLRFAIEDISKLESYFTHTPNIPIPLSSLSPPLPRAPFDFRLLLHSTSIPVRYCEVSARILRASHQKD